MPFKFYPQLTSSIVIDDERSLDRTHSLLCGMPSLLSLKLNNDRYKAIDGSQWEHLFATKWPLLKNFEFYIRLILRPFIDDIDESRLNRFIVPLCTPFWTEERRWLVTCNYLDVFEDIEMQFPHAESPANGVSECAMLGGRPLVQTKVWLSMVGSRVIITDIHFSSELFNQRSGLCTCHWSSATNECMNFVQVFLAADRFSSNHWTINGYCCCSSNIVWNWAISVGEKDQSCEDALGEIHTFVEHRFSIKTKVGGCQRNDRTSEDLDERFVTPDRRQTQTLTFALANESDWVIRDLQLNKFIRHRIRRKEKVFLYHWNLSTMIRKYSKRSLMFSKSARWLHSCR